MSDIVPALLEELERRYTHANETDPRLAGITKRIRDGTPRVEDAHFFAEYRGENLAQAFQDTLRPGVLPDDRMYYNIADRTVTPTMRETFAATQEAAAAIQKLQYADDGIGLIPVTADFPAERVAGLVDKVSGAATLEAAKSWLDEPLVNTAISYYDDFAQANARTAARAGLETTIERKLGRFERKRAAPIGKAKGRSYEVPCEWCRALAGTYQFNDLPPDIWRRHENCRCIITKRVGRLMQDMSTRRWYTDTGQSIRTADTSAYSRTQEEAAALTEAWLEEQKTLERERRAKLRAG